MTARLVRMYNPLVDIAFWLFVGSFLSAMVLRWQGSALGGTGQLLTQAVTLIGYANWLLCTFLVCARFMRDEYAQSVWQKASDIFAYVAVIAPAVLVIGFYALSGWLSASVAVPTEAERAAMAAYPSPRTWQLSGALHLLTYAAAYLPATFLGLYKWHRWRDSR